MKSTFKNNYPWLVIGFSALFLFYKYVLQVSPSVMTSALMQHFHLNGLGLGNLAAMYFYTYLVVQLFAGPLLDGFSARKLTSLAIFIAAIGAMIFALANSLWLAWLGRACIGIGAAFATVSYMKMAGQYFSVEKFAFISGLLATAAMLGSMGGEAPMAFLVKNLGWQSALFYCAIAGMMLAFLFFITVKDKNVTQKKNSQHFVLKDVLKVLQKKQNWLLMIYSGLAFTPLGVFGGLWGNAFLHAAYQLPLTETASLISVMFLGLAVGGPFFGYLASRIQKSFSLMLAGLLLSFLSISLVLYANQLTVFLLAMVLFLFGFGTGAFMLGFSMARQLNNAYLLATVVSLINTGDAIFGAFSDPLTGRLLDAFKQTTLLKQHALFSLHDYHLALCLMPIYLLLAMVFWFWLYRESCA